ncbi:MAG: N-formylglutamate amidohydrolase [Acidobacteria bacterium]|nr:N-formylglutamate amidohydrolase [Acidobacteriota bacterium]
MTSFTTRRPDRAPVMLYDSPHSGRLYPADFETKAQGPDLRRGEDAYLDELLSDATGYGACVLLATYPRCYIDLNREDDDLAVGLLSDSWPWPVRPTEKSRKGLGLIRRFVTPGVEVNARLLTAAEIRRRIDEVYRPYHAALADLRDEIHQSCGAVWHINWHSMKSVGNAMTPDGDGAERPDFVVGDLDGRSAAPAFTALIVETLHGMGFSVRLNDPYKGGTIVKRFGDPAAGYHTVQIEMKRSLYLDESTVTKTHRFDWCKRQLMAFSRSICEAATTGIG